MTDERLAELRALSDKATPGPWFFDDEDGHIYTGGDFAVLNYATTRLESPDDDAPFIAASRTAIPELLDAIERVKKAVVKESYPDCDNFNTMEDCIRVSTILSALNGTDAANVPSVLSQTVVTGVPARYKRSVVSIPNPDR